MSGRGIIKPDTSFVHKPSNFIVQELDSNVATDQELLDYYSMPEARNIIKQHSSDSAFGDPLYIKAMLSSLDYNIV